jgi:hypothetical protein
MGKTGTTSIQNALRHDAEVLPEQGVSYLGMWFDGINPAFDGLAGYGKFVAQDPKFMVTSANRFYTYLTKRAKADNVDRFVMSNESLFQSGRKLEPFYHRLEKRGVQVSFLVYLRDPRSWLPSAYTQWAIRHKTNRGPVQPFEEAAKRLINHYNAIRFWVRTFGDQVTVRAAGQGIDVVEDFARTIGISLNAPPIRALERPEPADVLMRAMFNTRFEEPVLPHVFDQAWMNTGARSVPSLNNMAAVCFGAQESDEIIQGNAEVFEFIRDEVGLDFLSGSTEKMQVPDHNDLQRRIIDYLIEVTSEQGRRLRALEEQLAEFRDE